MSLLPQKGRIRNEIEFQNISLYKKISSSKKCLIDEIILKYDINNSILEHYKKTMMFDKENLQVEIDRFLLRRRMYLEKMCDEINDFEKLYEKAT
jgi:hypothetical protein